MPHCHSPFSFSNMPLSSMTAINQPLTPWRQGPWGAFVRPSMNTLELYEGCRLTEQHSPPPHLDKGLGPRTSTVHTHTSLTSSINTKRTNIKLKGNHKMSGRTNRAETLKAPRHSSTLPRLTFHCSFICLMFSIQRKWLQSNQKTQLNILFSVFTSFKNDVPIFPEINSLIHVWKYNFPKTDSPIFDIFTEKDKHILHKQATRSNQLPLSRLVELRLTVKQKRSLSFV